MRQINISVIDKLPKITSMSGTAVSDNTYQFVFTFDDDWTDGTKTVYVVGISGKFVPYIMDGNSLEITFNDDRYIYVGVSQGTTVTSRSCKIEIKPSIKHNTGEEISPPEPGIYDQIMQKLNELEQSGVSPEQIAAAVEQYITENPITAADVNAVPQNQGVENAGKFLSINESGEVIPVESGADGITPHIGANGNWYIGDTDTGIKAQGEKGEKGDPGEKGTTPHIGENGNWWIGDTDTGVKAVASGGSGTDIALGISGATVGQIAKVKAVDASGAPTEWEAEKDTTPFIVTVGSDNANGYTSSHTFDEIAAAAIAGRVVMAYTDYIDFPDVNQSLYGTYFDLISTQDVAQFRYTDGLLEYFVIVSPSETSASAGYLSATSSSFGGIKADSAEATDTQPVRIGEDGKLYTAPRSGGGDGTWRTIAEIQTDGTVNQYEITQDADGNPLNLTEMIIRYVGLKGETVNTYQAVWINDVQVSYRHALTTTSATKYETFWMRKTGKYIYGICNEATKDGISGMNTAWRAGGIYLSSEVFPNDEGIQKIRLGNNSVAVPDYLNGITITIFGK